MKIINYNNIPILITKKLLVTFYLNEEDTTEETEEFYFYSEIHKALYRVMEQGYNSVYLKFSEIPERLEMWLRLNNRYYFKPKIKELLHEEYFIL